MSTDDERQQAALREYARSLSPEEWNMFAAQVRPPEPVDPATSRASIKAKSSQLWAVTQQCTDGNGYTAGMSDAAAARARPAPAPQPPPAVVEVPRRGGYIGSDSLRRTPFTPPATPTTND